MLVRFYSFLAAKLVPGIEISKCGEGAEDVRSACGDGATGVLLSSGFVKIFRGAETRKKGRFWRSFCQVNFNLV